MLRIIVSILAILALLLMGRFTYMSMTAETPEGLGRSAGRLSPCPESPNCASSQAENPKQRVDPLIVNASADEALEKAAQAIESMPRSRIVTSGDGYLHAEFASALFRFIDDLELVFDESLPGFHVRSASRVGYSDMGANRKRIEALRNKLSSS